MSNNGNGKAIVKYFGDKEVQFIPKDGELWLTAEQVGKALGYKDPQKRISEVINRNRDEFEGLIGIRKMRTPGGMQDTTILSRDAINLVCMLSKAPKAKEFRKWVLKILKEIQTKGFYSDKPIPRPLLVAPVDTKAIILAEQNVQEAKSLYMEEKGKLEGIYDNIIQALESELGKMKSKKARLNAFKPFIEIPVKKANVAVQEELSLPGILKSEKEVHKESKRTMMRDEAIEIIYRNANITVPEKRPDNLIVIAKAFDCLCDYYLDNIDRVADKVGCSTQKIYSYLAMLTWEPEIRHLLETRQLDSYEFLCQYLTLMPSDRRIYYAKKYAFAVTHKEKREIKRQVVQEKNHRGVK